GSTTPHLTAVPTTPASHPDSRPFPLQHTPPPALSTLPLHDALPISYPDVCIIVLNWNNAAATDSCLRSLQAITYPVYEVVLVDRSEEHTSELHSRENLVCRLLLEKKKRKIPTWSGGAVHKVPIRYPS